MVFLLSRDRIRQLNRAGLDHLQISIDNVVPDEVSKKSLKVLDQKRRWLAEEGAFDALTITRRAPRRDLFRHAAVRAFGAKS